MKLSGTKFQENVSTNFAPDTGLQTDETDIISTSSVHFHV
jgi:hypothetical protein